ncbi:hypothetical protein GCM10017559_04990 [Streptosporangium longisporum]|uniref:Uncharacterized protein n=1 Tax=Streptosporangium longisporum TaxID=46187 RepID=A0ABN3XQM0_9ACTN
MWAGGILVAVAAGLSGYVAGVGLEEGDRLASVIAAITGLAGLGVALYGLKQPSPGAAPAPTSESPAVHSAATEPATSPSSPPPGAGRSYGGDHVEIHGTFHGPVQGKGAQHNLPPSPRPSSPPTPPPSSSSQP